jgi:hypothetical protein
MVKIKGKGGISATIVADSVSPNGKRITTFELEYPRFIHSEFMTHRLFSRNAASSRAIPVPKMIANIKANTARPIHWGANQPGMKADNECDNPVSLEALQEFDEPSDSGLFQLIDEDVSHDEAWNRAMGDAVYTAECFHKAGYHKQIVNRLLEPFQFIKVVCTATEYDNFFWLRDHKDAQPEIKELASCMWEAREKSDPVELKIGEWHLPYADTDWLNTDEALKVSASCCAQVSYRLADTSVEKAIKIYDMLVSSSPVHASPFEHAATPMDDKVTLDTEGITGYNNGLGYVSGNFAGWVQYRQLIPDNACWSYEPE